MQLQLQNLAPVMATSLHSQLLLFCNVISHCSSLCTLAFQLGGEVGVWFRQETLSTETISSAVPSGFMWGCWTATVTGGAVLANASGRAEGLEEMVGGEKRGAIGKMLPACENAGPDSAWEMRGAPRSSQRSHQRDEGSQTFSLWTVAGSTLLQEGCCSHPFSGCGQRIGSPKNSRQSCWQPPGCGTPFSSHTTSLPGGCCAAAGRRLLEGSSSGSSDWSRKDCGPWRDSPSHRALTTGAADLVCSGAADEGAAPTQRK